MIRNNLEVRILSTAADVFDAYPYAAFLLRRLFKPCGPYAARSVQAVAETEQPIDGDVWVWADDNAKVLELLFRPSLWRRFPDETGEILRFLRSMCDGPFIFRRIGAPRLERLTGDDSTGSWIHSLMHIRTDLLNGSVMLGVRFHDGRTAQNVFLAGNYMQFRHRGLQLTLDVEDAITKVSSRLGNGQLVVSHAGDLHFDSQGGLQHLGRVTYTYQIKQHSMLVQVEVALEINPEVEVEDVVLTIGHDNLSHGENNVHYSRIGLLSPEGATTWHNAGEAGAMILPAMGSTYYSLAQEEMHGFALCIHTRPHDPAKLQELRIVQQQPNRLHWVVAAYHFPGQHRGIRLAAAEDKLLTAGGFPTEAPAYARLMQEAAEAAPDAWPRDLSISYDYGVEINAFAKGYAVLAAGEVDGPPGLADELKELTDRYLDAYQARFVSGFWEGENAVFSRQIAFVIMAAATMLRATGDERYRSHLAALVEVLLQFEVALPDAQAGSESGFLMGLRSSRDIHVDCHSAALLALTCAAPWLPDPRIEMAIDRGLNAYALVTGSIEWAGGVKKVDTLGLHWIDDAGKARVSHAFWNFHVGLTLRLLHALQYSPDARMRALYVRHAERIAVIEPLLRRQIALSRRYHEDGIEIRTSWLSAETNSETQPWVVMGLLKDP